MGDFVGTLQNNVLNQPVEDETGLNGKWDSELRWTPDETQFANAPVKAPPPPEDTADAPPPLFTALEEQLGLKLEGKKMQAPVLVIDQVNPPSPN